ncbi:DMT family transporter [Clostridium sp.]|uniref:DMT family transporter n=1 Tax=Clostridium sp. TaxID=1506 RepID=UPI003F3C1C25
MLMVILAILGGILTTLSLVINSSLGKRIGVLQSTLINYIVGIICSLIVLILLGSSMDISLAQIKEMPFYIFLGGLLGVVVVYSSNIVIPKIPVVYSALLLFIGQIVAGVIIDYFIIGELEIGKILGGIIVTIGILYNSRIDAKSI